MITKEMLAFFKEKRARIFVILIILIPLWDLILMCGQANVIEVQANKAEYIRIDAELKASSEIDGCIYIPGWLCHPAKASFLSGSTSGHLAQVLLLWLMPLFVLNLCSDRVISEHSRGYLNGVLARSSKRRYYCSKLFASFIIPLVVFLLSFLVNFGLSQIIFFDGDRFGGVELFAEYGGWFAFMYDSPNLAYLIYALATAVAAGLCGVICQCVAFLTKKYVITYLITFFIWMAMVMMDDSITYLMQPFTEYGLDYMIRSGAILLGVTLICIVTVAVAKVKKDELQ